MARFIVGLALLLASISAFAFEGVLGEVTPSVTPANVQSTICKAGYTDTVRPSTYYTGMVKSLLAGGDEAGFRACAGVQYLHLRDWKKAVYACKGSFPMQHDKTVLAQYELDHKVPLEAGGHPESLNNLWLETLAHARLKDQLENSVKRDVCAGKLSLRRGQRKFIEPLPGE